MNPFDILGIPKNSSKSVAQQAYRRLAMKLHPDRNSARDAEAKFKLVKEAWEMIENGYVEPINPPQPQYRRQASPPQYTGWQSKPDIPRKPQMQPKPFVYKPAQKPVNIFNDLVEDVIGVPKKAPDSSKFLSQQSFSSINKNLSQPKKVENLFGDFIANISEDNFQTGYQVDIQVENAKYLISVPPLTKVNLAKQYSVPGGYVTITSRLIS